MSVVPVIKSRDSRGGKNFLQVKFNGLTQLVSKLSLESLSLGPPDMDYQPVVVKTHPRPSSKHNPESRHWRQFKNPVFVKEYAPVTCVHFAPSRPHRYAVTAATRVLIYAPRTQKITKTIARFKDVARSGNIRGDGKLVVAGDDSGLIQVSFLVYY